MQRDTMAAEGMVALAKSIERESPVPYYEQLFGILGERIRGGEIAPEERLPSELELTREFGLSRATVRQTLAKLESEGLARKVARRGMFASVRDKPSGWIVQDEQGFLESQLRHGQTGIETEVVGARFAVPPAHVADALELGASEEVFGLERVRSLEGRIAMFSTNWFPAGVGRMMAAADDVLRGDGSVNTTLRQAGHVSAGARRIIHALGAPEPVAARLGVDEGTPVLRVRSLSWDHDGIRFDYYETWVLTDVVPLEVNVAAS